MVRNTGRTLTCTMAVTASYTAPQTVQATIKLSPNDDGKKEVFVPTTENWVLTDCYILTALDAAVDGTSNPQIVFVRDRMESLGMTTPLSALLISNNTRPRFLPTPIGYPAGSILTIFGITTVNNNSTADAFTWYVAVDVM